MFKARGQHEILTYEYSEVTHSIFLESYTDCKYSIEKEGKIICTIHISHKLRTLLEPYGYTFIKIRTSYSIGQKTIFGFKMNVVKETKKGKIYTLKVHVLGDSLSKVRENAKSIINGIWVKYHIKPVDVNTQLRAECS